MPFLDNELIRDVIANLPAAGSKGRRFTSTDENKEYYDDGAAWQTITSDAGQIASGTLNAARLPFTFVDDETPGGAIDGSNTTFSLAHTPNPLASLQLYLNGVLQIQSIDYAMSSPVSGDVTFLNDAPGFGSSPITATIRAFYRY